MGKHSLGSQHQSGDKQQPAKQGKAIREWAKSEGQGITTPKTPPTSHRKGE